MNMKSAKFGDQVMVRYGGAWHRGVVVNADGYSGFHVTVYVEATLHDKSHLDGHGVNIAVSSKDFKAGWR